MCNSFASLQQHLGRSTTTPSLFKAKKRSFQDAQSIKVSRQRHCYFFYEKLKPFCIEKCFLKNLVYESVRVSMFLYSVKFGRWLNMQYFTDTFSWLFMFLSWLDNCLLEQCESVYNSTSHASETLPNQICCMVVARLE